MEPASLPAPGSPEFFAAVWRRRPAVYRRLYTSAAVREFQGDRFASWSRRPASARFFSTAESLGPGRARAVPVADPAVGWDTYRRYRADKAVTLLLNHVEQVDPTVTRLYAPLGIPYRWRLDDIAASLSAPNAGIGYHADIQDTFVVQVEGARRWRVWLAGHLPDAYHRELLTGFECTTPLSRSDAPPAVDDTLEPGDVLYIPALCPHEGVTVRESVSVSLSWRGVSAYHVLALLRGRDRAAAALPPEGRSNLLTLVPDVAPGPDAARQVTSHLTELFAGLGADRPATHETERVVYRILSCDSFHQWWGKPGPTPDR